LVQGIDTATHYNNNQKKSMGVQSKSRTSLQPQAQQRSVEYCKNAGTQAVKKLISIGVIKKYLPSGDDPMQRPTGVYPGLAWHQGYLLARRLDLTIQVLRAPLQ
jgi:hypothetical protein